MPDYTFKTIYFPASRTRRRSAARVTLSIPREPTGANITARFLEFVHSLSGQEIRAALGDPYLEDLELAAQQENRNFSNACLHRLLQDYRLDASECGNDGRTIVKQKGFSFADPAASCEAAGSDDGEGFGVTFRQSRRLPV